MENTRTFLKDLFSETTVEKVSERLLELYHHASKEGHEAAFAELKELCSSCEHTSKDGEIVITEQKLSELAGGLTVEEEDGPVFDVTWVSREGAHYSMDFMEWNEALALPISEESLKKFPRLDIAAHVLYEITFVGFSQGEVRVAREEVESLATEVMASWPESS